jgi:hypothetical protein
VPSFQAIFSGVGSWLQAIAQAIHDGNWGDIASVAGVLISIIGFGFTLFGLARSKSAAKQVESAVADVRQRFFLKSVAVDLDTLMSDIEEIKQLHRFGTWAAMPSRYFSIRKRLLLLKGNTPTLSKSQKASIQGCVEQFKEIAEIVEVALATKETPKDVAALNRIATEQSDKLTAVLVTVQQAIGS